MINNIKNKEIYLCPKPLKDKQNISQEFKNIINFIRNNLSNFNIFIFSESSEITNWCIENQIEYIDYGFFSSKYRNIPSVKKIFEIIFSRRIYCKYQIYINSDLILNEDFINLLNFADNQNDDFFISGCRLNVERHNKNKYLKSKFQHWGTDYFIFSLPILLCKKDFLLGRYFWDSHILTNVFRFYKKGNCRLFDASGIFLPFHLNHKYDWGKRGNKTTQLSLISKEILHNLLKSNPFENICIKAFKLLSKKDNLSKDYLVVSNCKRIRQSNIYKIKYFVNYFRLLFLNLINKQFYL